MYIQDEIVKIYFRHVSPNMILDGRIHYKNFPKREFEELLFCYMKEYSETEIRLLYENLKSLGDTDGACMENNLNVFKALEDVAKSILTVRDNEIKCRYTELQRWRNIGRNIGDDLLICSYVGYLCRNQPEWNYYEWDTIIGHTNAQLNAIISQGISENHFHLFGSAPVFQLVWLKLMNNINQNTYVKALAGIDKKRRNINYHYDRQYREDSMELLVLKAALIRVTLYCYLNIEKYGKILEEKIEGLLKYLNKGIEILDIQKEIRDIVNLLKEEKVSKDEKSIIDYAIECDSKNNINWIFTGERKIIIKLLYKLFKEKSLPDYLANLLYAYLVMRSMVRAEIVQNNENVGFENFSEYNKRKNGFLVDSKDIENMVKYAVHGSFKSGNLKSLEIRIMPQKSYLDNAKYIHQFDKIISSQGEMEKNKFYYVYHFSKKEDCWSDYQESIDIPCRDYNIRRSINQKSKEIIKFRHRIPKEASRVKGIDACSQEIGCRPEVFAPAFRKLTNDIVSFESGNPVKQLKQTYHAGEDFLDVADGLRALDEAIRFLNMRSGDRFGHATVLGINVKQWYLKKNNIIFLKSQDYLDNIVWLYHMLLEFQIEGCEVLKTYLLQQYETYFREIYLETSEDKRNYNNIYTYYDAWKLRGDSPFCYTSFMRSETKNVIEEQTEREALNDGKPEYQKIRQDKEVVMLYCDYHYNRNVRKKGNRPLEIKVPKFYVEGIEKIQKEMQKMISRKGIGIETNPSSNVLISSIEGYDEHPILNLYNKGLKKENSDELQMYVSINTDDKGVFNTSLENEYALMASALENLVDENGKFIYNKQDVYEWIDRVRVMGNHQIFS